jgi:hypothetical protein
MYYKYRCTVEKSFFAMTCGISLDSYRNKNEFHAGVNGQTKSGVET